MIGFRITRAARASYQNVYMLQLAKLLLSLKIILLYEKISPSLGCIHG